MNEQLILKKKLFVGSTSGQGQDKFTAASPLLLSMIRGPSAVLKEVVVALEKVPLILARLCRP